MCIDTHVLEIRLGTDENDNVVCCCRCCCRGWSARDREDDEDGVDDLKKNERKRVNLLGDAVACFIEDLGRGGGVIEWRTVSLPADVAEGAIGWLSVVDIAVARDWDNDDATDELRRKEKKRKEHIQWSSF